MNMIYLLYNIIIYLIYSSDSRLIEKITDRTLTIETKTGSSPPLRLARQVDAEDTLTGISKEDSDEYIKKLRHYTADFDVELSDHARIRRDSGEQIERTVRNANSSSVSSSAHGRIKSSVLVKKPIPKYNDMDYDDDFQMKINRSPVKVLESGEHEDEDFNLDDYDFDVNHDEFSGRGKPLEPRLKYKEIVANPKPQPKPAAAPEIKIKSKVNIPSPHEGTSNKKERSAEMPKKTGDKEDYYDDSASNTKVTPKARDLEDEFNEDNEESKEFDSKMPNVRMARSPWKFAEKLGDKTSAIMTKILTILPMFPQVPHKLEESEFNIDNVQHNDVWSNRGLRY